MTSQEEIIRNFKATFGLLQLKEISKLTGIHMTRVFRLMNGYKMSLDESQKFIAATLSTRKGPELIELARDCEAKLPSLVIDEIALLMKRRLRLSELTVSNPGGAQ